MSIQYRDGSFSEDMPAAEAAEEFFRALEQGTARSLHVGTKSELAQIKKETDLRALVDELCERIEKLEDDPLRSEHIVIPTKDEIIQCMREQNGHGPSRITPHSGSMSNTKIPPGYVMDSAGNLRQIKTYENVWDAIYTETELAKQMQEYMELRDALSKLVEGWEAKKVCETEFEIHYDLSIGEMLKDVKQLIKGGGPAVKRAPRMKKRERLKTSGQGAC